jgi:purine-binding chemotaxis protein CheW
MATTCQFCTFTLDGLLFGIELRCVQEVVRDVEMTPVSLAPPVVCGVINLRGQIVTALDLRRCLDLAPRAAKAQENEAHVMNVVVRTEDGAVSLLVDEIGDVVEVGDETFEPAPETVKGAARPMILGVHKLVGQLMHVLDTEKICHISDESEVERVARAHS